MTADTDRRLAEQCFHDRQAAARAATRPELRFADADFLDHETWVRELARVMKPGAVGCVQCGWWYGAGMQRVFGARTPAAGAAFGRAGGEPG